MVISERMEVDQEFADRVRASEFSGQEWNLVMTAVEFEIEHADDPDRAHVVADTEKLPSIMPELESLGNRMTSMGGDPGGRERGSDSGGFLDSVRRALGVGGDDADDERLRAAEEMTQEYARKLQEALEETGRWEQVRAAAAEESAEGTDR